ncbi:DUF6236 family protein [Streptomyces sp. NPDC059687]|uniref:DUF6236 family protein n=1 Tax=Streptomyces sp. NPDC059687 TaxID=3346905 RepID=UPI0036779FFA
MLADELGFVVSVPPDRSATAVAGIFIEAIERDTFQLAREFGVFAADLAVRPDNVHVTDGAANSWLPYAHAAVYGSPPRPLKRLAGVYLEEVAPPLREALTQAGLALETSRQVHTGTASRRSGQWLAMDPRLAWAYKCALTEHLARVNELDPLTDGIASYALTEPWTADRVLELLNEPTIPDRPRDPGHLEDFASVEGTAAQVAMLAMQLVVPENLRAVPAERIVAVRKQCGPEFDAFRDTVSAAADELAALPRESADPAIVTAYLDQVVARRFEQPLANLHSAMRGLNVETALSAAAMKFELPAAITALGGSWLAGQPAAAAAGGLAFALVGLGRSWKQGQQAQLGASPESYLLRVEKGLKPRSLLARVRNPRRHDARTT